MNRLPDSTAFSSRKYDLALLLIFVFSLPLLNPWVRGDGVGYYAFARAPLIQRNFDFRQDYLAANASFRNARIDENGAPLPVYRTPTGHLENHFSVGPAILWSPFLLLAHGTVLMARAFGSSVTADGFSAPYRIAMAFGTALYGFLGLLIAFRLACKYVGGEWAFASTVAIWWASSLPIYMYFNPSWSHAQSAFAVALFVWCWHRSRNRRSLAQWILLGALAGLMLNVYYANAMVLMILVVEGVRQYIAAFRGHKQSDVPGKNLVQKSPIAQNRASPGAESPATIQRLLLSHFLFCITLLVCMLPTFITRYIVYGNPFESGYIPLRDWLWRSPVFLSVLFSSDHGLLSWTPIIMFALAGLCLFYWKQPRIGAAFLAATVAFYLLISCYPDWAGISSFGNRFFVSLTIFFILGLAFLLEKIALTFRKPRAAAIAISVLLFCFVIWNTGFMFQWGTHLVPARGPISWSAMIENQFTAVPQNISAQLQKYLFKRKALMQQIEERDDEQLKQQPPFQ